ncbi:MAG: hypothetical protein H7256_10675 [Bdellovibrio sp.]|nr:hypothetical protein [Bdellovibrio sp.]
MKNVKIYILLCLAFFVSSCAAHSKKNSTDAKEKVGSIKEIKPNPYETTKPSQRVIDYSSVQRLLNLDRRYTELGFFEKMFDTCQVGFGYAPDLDCQKKYFTVIHFKLVCRQSEGTISTVLTDDDLKAISGENVNWYLKNANGSTLTDSEGYGQIIATTNESQKNQRLRLAVGAEFLMTKASEAKRLIAPLTWCNH